MGRFLARALLACIGLCALLLFADMLAICLLESTLVDLLWDTDFFPSASATAIIARIEAIVAFAAAGLIVLFRSAFDRMVSAFLDRLARRVAGGSEGLQERDARPAALVTAMLLVLGVMPILIYVIYEGSRRFRDFFEWPLLHTGWLVVSTILLVGLIKRRYWAYCTLIGLCVVNLLLSALLAIRLLGLVVGNRFHGPHGFGALAALGAFIGLIMLVVYLGVSAFLTTCLWRRRKSLAPVGLSHASAPDENG